MTITPAVFKYALPRPPPPPPPPGLQVFRFDQSIAHVANSLVGPLKGETRPLLGCAGKQGEVSGTVPMRASTSKVATWLRTQAKRLQGKWKYWYVDYQCDGVSSRVRWCTASFCRHALRTGRFNRQTLRVVSNTTAVRWFASKFVCSRWYSPAARAWTCGKTRDAG